MDLIIRTINIKDWHHVSEIYKQGIETGNATFEIKVPSWEEWNSKYLPFCRLGAEIQNELAGWAALLPVSARDAYQGAAEVSVYISTEHTGKGIGTKLLNELVKASESAGIWSLQAGIFPENTASINLHKSCGFRKVGYREKIGKLNGIWRNTLIFERRSKIII